MDARLSAQHEQFLLQPASLIHWLPDADLAHPVSFCRIPVPIPSTALGSLIRVSVGQRLNQTATQIRISPVFLYRSYLAPE